MCVCVCVCKLLFDVLFSFLVDRQRDELNCACCLGHLLDQFFDLSELAGIYQDHHFGLLLAVLLLLCLIDQLLDVLRYDGAPLLGHCDLQSHVSTLYGKVTLLTQQPDYLAGMDSTQQITFLD